MSQLLTIFVNILAPVFGLVLVGYFAGPRLALDARTLTKFAYYILVPAFVFNVFSDAEIVAGTAARMVGYMTAITLGTVLVAIVAARLLRCSPQMTGAFVLVAAFGNVGNFGLPIIQFKLGDEALVAASVYFLAGSTLGFVIGVMAATWHRGSSWGAAAAAFKTPGVLAIFPAFLVNGLDWQTPLFLGRGIGLLAAALIPVMLVTLGVQLADMGRPRFSLNVVVAGSIRLIVGPILAIALAGFFGMSDIARGAGILQAAMPVAVLASLVALEHDLLPDFVTTTVLFSTLASAVTLTVVLAIV